MIKCPECGTAAEDGTLFCEQCKFDLAAVPPMSAGEGSPPAEAAAAPSEFSEFSASGTDQPMDAMPMDAMPMEAMGATSGVELMEGSPPGADMGLGLEAGPPSGTPSQMRPPTGVRQSQMRPPTGIPQSPSQMRPPTGMPPQSPSQMRPPTGIPSSPSQMRPPTGIPSSPSQMRPPTGMRPSQMRPPTGMPPAAPAPRVSMLAPEERPRLIVVRGLKTDVEYLVYDGTNYIGRFDDKPVDIDLDDQEAPESIRTSRQHACVTYENGAMSIEDCNSANGTFVNRQRLNPGEKRPIKTGDYIQVGTVMFKVKIQ